MDLPKNLHNSLPERLPESYGFSRNSIQYQGDDDYVEVPDDPALDGMSELTVSMFILYTSTAGEQWPIGRGGAKPYGIRLKNGTQDCAVTNDAGTRVWLLDAFTPSADEWIHLAMTYDGSKIRLYRNGVFQADANQSGNLNTTTNLLYIGAYNDSYYFLNGIIDEVKIYTTALSEEEIREDMLNYHKPVSPGNLVGWWRMEEGKGTTVYDKSGNGNDGTMYNFGAEYGWKPRETWELRAKTEL